MSGCVFRVFHFDLSAEIDSAVRPDLHVDRAEPDIARGGELAIRVGASGDFAYAVWFQYVAVEEISRALGREGIVAILFGPGVTPIDGGASGGRDVPGGSPVSFNNSLDYAGGSHSHPDHPMGLGRTDAENIGPAPCGRDQTPGSGSREKWVSSYVGVFKKHEEDVIAVAGEILVTPGIETQSELGRTVGRGQIEGLRIECEVAAPDQRGIFLGMIGAANRAPARATGGVNSVIQSPAKTVGQMLPVAIPEAIEDNSADIREAVAVGVFAV